VNVTGLASGQTLSAIDFRPATGQLYGSTATGQLYTIDPTTGARHRRRQRPGARASAATSRTSTSTPTGRPHPRRHRHLTRTPAANPETGALVDARRQHQRRANRHGARLRTGDAGAGADPNIVATAYTNSVQGATGTTLYALDAARDALVTIGSVQGAARPSSPNTGQLFTVGKPRR
jgi:hypothetical protein